ncbi:nucleotidyltransferase domain-containing protein, partial [bacterium]|nr:nucleotidyltransferase domain-containing protein [bacterium]
MKKGFEKDLIKNLSKFFKKEKEVLFCYLFGSRAYGKPISTSDIDLAVYLDEKKCRDLFEKRLELVSQISQIMHKDVDILVLNNSSPFLKYVVLKEGKLIFEKEKGKRIDFELRAMNEYFDY